MRVCVCVHIVDVDNLQTLMLFKTPAGLQDISRSFLTYILLFPSNLYNFPPSFIDCCRKLYKHPTVIWGTESLFLVQAAELFVCVHEYLCAYVLVGICILVNSLYGWFYAAKVHKHFLIFCISQACAVSQITLISPNADEMAAL